MTPDPTAPVKAGGEAAKGAAKGAAGGAKGIAGKVKKLPPWAWIAGGGVGLFAAWQISKSSGGAPDPNADQAFAYDAVPNYSIPVGGTGGDFGVVPPATGDTGITPLPVVEPDAAAPIASAPDAPPEVQAPPADLPPAPQYSVNPNQFSSTALADTGGGPPDRSHPSNAHAIRSLRKGFEHKKPERSTKAKSKKRDKAKAKQTKKKLRLPRAKKKAPVHKATKHKVAPRKPPKHKPRKHR